LATLHKLVIPEAPFDAACGVAQGKPRRYPGSILPAWRWMNGSRLFPRITLRVSGVRPGWQPV